MQPHARRRRGHPSKSTLATGTRQRNPHAIAHGDLRLLVLALLRNQARHGYELIQLIGEIFHGQYLPSAGAMYPVLSQLQESGLVNGIDDGLRRLYQLSDTGRAFVRDNADSLAQAQARTTASARILIKASLPAPVREAMQSLKHAIAQHHQQWDEAMARQVEYILQQTSDQIAQIGR